MIVINFLTIQRMMPDKDVIDTDFKFFTPLSRIFYRPRRLLNASDSLDVSRVEERNLPETIPANVYTWTGKELYKQKFVGDRFIPQRKSLKSNAFNFHFEGKVNKIKNENELQVLEQIKSLPTEWRKRGMNAILLELNIFPGQQQNLQNNNNINNNDKLWQCRPRKKPLMCSSHKEIFRFPFFIRGRHLVDWGKQNYIVMAIDGGVGVFDADSPSKLNYENYDNSGYVTVVKWNNDGSKFAIGHKYRSNISKITMKHLRTKGTEAKLENKKKANRQWFCNCPCDEYLFCEIVNICWSSTDKFILGGCSSGIMFNLNEETGKIENTVDCESDIIHFSLSPNDKYLAVTFQDKSIKIFFWPDFEPYMNMQYYKRIKSLAWHPWNNHILCVGGGHNDGSLSVWNVNVQKPLQYRTIDFTGTVENLLFNKLTGELIVHWSCYERGERQVKIVVLENLDKIVDFIPIEKDVKILNIISNPDHTKLALPCRDTITIWNIFGQENQSIKKKKIEKFIDTNVFAYYNIR
ncbi:protein cortex isoform X2 [Leptopilina boulardi]|uniref:protein cortex isoform X2 n=1 Tax=Leptopilina boulardi TaxID=63433 RepID=UPI0021F59EE7|nr:protein cortex isoform X2 [Leptopilina boulardi]